MGGMIGALYELRWRSAEHDQPEHGLRPERRPLHRLHRHRPQVGRHGDHPGRPPAVRAAGPLGGQRPVVDEHRRLYATRRNDRRPKTANRRTMVAIAPINPQRVYVVWQQPGGTGKPEKSLVLASSDGGRTFAGEPVNTAADRGGLPGPAGGRRERRPARGPAQPGLPRAAAAERPRGAAVGLPVLDRQRQDVQPTGRHRPRQPGRLLCSQADAGRRSTTTARRRGS